MDRDAVIATASHLSINENLILIEIEPKLGGYTRRRNQIIYLEISRETPVLCY